MSAKIKVAMVVTAMVSLLGLSGAGEGGCGDEAVEAVLCQSATKKICDKWFSCFPLIAKTAWTDVTTCHGNMHGWCAQSEALLGCDINNDKLRLCDTGIKSSACGTLPAECTAIFNCYTNNPK